VIPNETTIGKFKGPYFKGNEIGHQVKEIRPLIESVKFLELLRKQWSLYR
jgi:hypothetical protein